ncbi:MAG: hypothetical protein HOH43_23135 [Candidatus Latescibacteria bacterium]|nr:hypothetical protein [Candidatus Latescibacterota bacterium]
MRKPDAVIQAYNGRPTVFVDGVAQSFPGFNPKSVREPFETSLPFFANHKMGVYIIQAMMQNFWRGDEIFESPSAPEGELLYDVDEQASAVLAQDPDAYIMVRFTPSPPMSWRELHPQELVITEGRTTGSPSLASNLFWETMSRVSAAIVAYCESSEWAHRLIGYTNFHVTEGTHIPVDQGWLYDHNPLMAHCWRSHLREKYQSDSVFHEAYGTEKSSLDSATIPTDPLLGNVPEVAEYLYWQNSQDNPGLRDYLELQRDLWHQRFRQVCLAMVKSVDRNVIFLYDALKQTQMGWNLTGFFGEHHSWRPAYPEVLAGSGHMSVASLFDAPGCDGLMTPLDYQARGIGGVCEAEGIADSLILRGKYYFAEMDQRTSPVGDREYGTPRNSAEFSAVTWRNFAAAWTRGFNAYWFDIGGGYYDTDSHHQVISRQVAAIKESIHWPHETMPGIAMILDDTSVLETNGAGNYLNEAVMWEQKMGLARCGVPHRIYLFDDLTLDNFPDHRVYYFPNLFRVDDERLEILKEKVFRNGNVVLWGPGSGISDGRTTSPDHASKLTGFSFDMLRLNTQRRIILTNFDHPITGDVSSDTILGGPLAYGPVLFPTDGTELGMALTKWQANQVGLAVRTFGKGTRMDVSDETVLGHGDYASIFTTAIPIPANLWRGMARYAGAHVYCSENDILMADLSLVALHSMKSGTKTIRLPSRSKVHDIVSNTPISSATDEIIFELSAPETRIFRIDQL